ncbi:MAG: hypothetical protein IPN29_11870 [Saprospiraceae bacterium]|nr:hypothetical protein [Saprospiraceae bacterium]
MYQEINALRKAATFIANELVPLEHDDIKNLSNYRFQGKKSGGIKPVYLGTIFSENMVGSISKKIGKQDNGVLVVYTHHDEFAYVKIDHTTEIFLNEQPLGKLLPNGLFYDLHSKAVAKISSVSGEGFKSVQVGTKTLCVFNSSNRNSTTERLFTSAHIDQKQDRDILLALTFYVKLFP